MDIGIQMFQSEIGLATFPFRPRPGSATRLDGWNARSRRNTIARWFVREMHAFDSSIHRSFSIAIFLLLLTRLSTHRHVFTLASRTLLRTRSRIHACTRSRWSRNVPLDALDQPRKIEHRLKPAEERVEIDWRSFRRGARSKKIARQSIVGGAGAFAWEGCSQCWCSARYIASTMAIDIFKRVSIQITVRNITVLFNTNERTNELINRCIGCAYSRQFARARTKRRVLAPSCPRERPPKCRRVLLSDRLCFFNLFLIAGRCDKACA